MFGCGARTRYFFQGLTGAIEKTSATGASSDDAFEFVVAYDAADGALTGTTVSYDATLRRDVYTSPAYWDDTADGGRIWIDTADDGLGIAGRTTSSVPIKSANPQENIAANSDFAVHLGTDAGHRMLAYTPNWSGQQGRHGLPSLQRNPGPPAARPAERGRPA